MTTTTTNNCRISQCFKKCRTLVNYYRGISTSITGGCSTSSTIELSYRNASSSCSSTTTTNSSSPVGIAFDRNFKRLQRDGASRAVQKWRKMQVETYDAHSTTASIADYDYFRREIASRLVDRLEDIRREEGFPLALDLGCGSGNYLYRSICSDDALTPYGGGIGGIRKLVQLDSSPLSLHRDDNDDDDNNNNVHAAIPGAERCQTYQLVADEEAKPLPFPDATFDLVLSSNSLHFVNDLPRLMKEVRRILKPDGCFMFAMVGGSTLPELRSCLVLAEMERDGGVSPHVGPFIDFPDVGSLLSAAGFQLPTIDIDTIQIAYPDAAILMEHLQRMGENNACINRRNRVPLDIFLATAALYQQLHQLESTHDDTPTPSVDDMTIQQKEEESIVATVQVIYGIGWTPHKSQPKPLPRGSATKKIGQL